jgi:hypothetical protein
LWVAAERAYNVGDDNQWRRKPLRELAEHEAD